MSARNETEVPNRPRARGIGWMGWPMPDGVRLAAVGIAVLVMVPLGTILAAVFAPTNGIWKHLMETVLVELLWNTLWLVCGVGAGTILVGVSLAWLTAVCDYPGRKVFDWALMLPLAIPAYVVAFVFIGLLEYTGPVQTQLREWVGSQQVWFPRIRSTGGVILVMTLAFYPYVYLLSRNAFLTQGKRALEAAQSLGHGQWSAFFRTSLPMAWPWIGGGLMLALMETLADFGAVATFNYDTFTTAIYKVWFGMFSLSAAAQLSSLLVLIVFVLILIEQAVRSRPRFVQVGKGAVQEERLVLRGVRGWLAFGYSAVVLSIGFLIPVGQLSFWAYEVFGRDFDHRYLSFLTHSLLLGAAGALVTCASAMILVYADRRSKGLWMRVTVKIAMLGYALPGVVLAVGIFIPIAWLDNQIILWINKWWDLEMVSVLKGTIVVMLLAYLVRFLAVAHNPIDSAMQRITPTIDEAARSLKCGSLALLRRIHLPMLRGGVLTAVTLIFVEVMKEMPITLMTRPFGWDTLSVRIFELTSEGEWGRAALPAVTLVLAGLVPVILLVRHASRNE